MALSLKRQRLKTPWERHRCWLWRRRSSRFEECQQGIDSLAAVLLVGLLDGTAELLPLVLRQQT